MPVARGETGYGEHDFFFGADGITLRQFLRSMTDCESPLVECVGEHPHTAWIDTPEAKYPPPGPGAHRNHALGRPERGMADGGKPVVNIDTVRHECEGGAGAALSQPGDRAEIQVSADDVIGPVSSTRGEDGASEDR